MFQKLNVANSKISGINCHKSKCQKATLYDSKFPNSQRKLWVKTPIASFFKNLTLIAGSNHRDVQPLSSNLSADETEEPIIIEIDCDQWYNSRGVFQTLPNI